MSYVLCVMQESVLRPLLANPSYEPCNMVYTKTLNNDSLQIIDIGKSWFIMN